MSYDQDDWRHEYLKSNFRSSNAGGSSKLWNTIVEAYLHLTKKEYEHIFKLLNKISDLASHISKNAVSGLKVKFKVTWFTAGRSSSREYYRYAVTIPKAHEYYDEIKNLGIHDLKIVEHDLGETSEFIIFAMRWEYEAHPPYPNKSIKERINEYMKDHPKYFYLMEFMMVLHRKDKAPSLGLCKRCGEPTLYGWAVRCNCVKHGGILFQSLDHSPPILKIKESELGDLDEKLTWKVLNHLEVIAQITLIDELEELSEENYVLYNGRMFIIGFYEGSCRYQEVNRRNILKWTEEIYVPMFDDPVEAIDKISNIIDGTRDVEFEIKIRHSKKYASEIQKIIGYWYYHCKSVIIDISVF